MADNALAPLSKNALTPRNHPAKDLLRETAEFPQYGELVEYLTSRRMLPPVTQTYYSGADGEFTYNSFTSNELPATGIIRAGRPSTLVHELTHAAQRQMGAQYNVLKKKSKLSPIEQQFMDAYEKLVFTPGEMFGRRPKATAGLTAKSMAPEWAKQKSDYRSTGSELQAFGMGSTVSPNTFNPAPLHVDPTYGTEFQVLLDLANRAQKLQPFTPGR